MTCREKLLAEHPEQIDPRHIGGCYGCPSFYGYAPDPKNGGRCIITCKECWDREVTGMATIDIEKPVTKVKIFARVAIPTLEDAINEFIVGKEIIDIKFQVNVFAGNPMGSAMVMYRETE